MKTKLMIFVPMLTIGFAISSQADIKQTAINMVSDFAVKQIEKNQEKAKEVLCKKADLPKGVISLRSFKGIPCKHELIAATAMAICREHKEFQGSGCHKNAKKTLKGVKGGAKGILDKHAEKAGPLQDLAQKVIKVFF